MEIISRFSHPFFFSNRISFSLENRLGYYNIEDIQLFGLKNLARVSYFIAPQTFYQNAFFDVTADILRIKYKTDFIEEDTVFFPAGTIDDQLNTIIGATAVHDRTNDIFNPSAGIYHAVTGEHAGALSRLINLFREGVNFSQYFKLFTPNKYFLDISSGDIVTSILATKLQLGEIFEYGLGDENVVPIQEIYKFYSGGSNSLRGWVAKTNGMVPDPESGGKFLVDGSIEHRLRPFPNDLGFMRDLWAVYFLDYGNIWNSHTEFHFNEIAMAVGFGARYYTFVGPIRVDFGFKLYDPKAADGKKWLFQQFNFKDKFAIQFGIGNAF
jgi:outer membrane protein assembly factor BamA